MTLSSLFTPSELSMFLNSQQTEKNTSRTIKVLPKTYSFESQMQKWNPSQFENYFGINYASHLHFDNLNILKNVIRNCPWILRSSKWGEEHRQLALKHKKELNTGFVANVSIRWIDDDFGYGVFAEEDFEENTYIGEYTGQIRTLSRWRPDSNAYCFQYPTRFLSWNYYIIDAFKEGNEMRFVNHSQEPNLQPSCLVDRGLSHLVFFTNQKIKKDEELTFDYGPDYWRHRKH
jgi:SET domain-containing protein